MKTFTARQLNQDRQEIREAILDGGCIVQFKHANREVEFEAVMIKKEAFDALMRNTRIKPSHTTGIL